MNRPIRWVALPLSLNVMLALLAACGQATQPPQPRPAQSATQSATRTAPSATSSPAVIAPTGNPSPSAPSEADRLAAFFAASAQLDNQLHQAAALVNGDIGATRILIKPATKAAVGQLQTTAIAGFVASAPSFRRTTSGSVRLTPVMASRCRNAYPCPDP